jgi:hypothetical protein
MRRPLVWRRSTSPDFPQVRVDSKRNPPPLLSSRGDPLRELRTAFRVELGCCFRAAARNAQVSCSVVTAEEFWRKVPRTMVTSSSASATESRLKNALYEFAQTFLLSVHVLPICVCRHEWPDVACFPVVPFYTGWKFVTLDCSSFSKLNLVNYSNIRITPLTL